MRKLLTLLIVLCFLQKANAQQPDVTSNWGKEFWVAYPIHQFMYSTYGNTQNMTLYLGVADLPAGVNYATVTVSVDSSGTNGNANWSRTYRIPANTSINIADPTKPAFSNTGGAGSFGPIPKGPINATSSATNPNYDFRLLKNAIPTTMNDMGFHTGKAIHIESDFPIAAYAHVYGSVASGATMLLPTNTWGLSYTTLNSAQNNADYSNSFFYVIAKENNTPILIVPSQPDKANNPPTPIYATLQKGQVYQYIGYLNNSTQVGVQLTGSQVVSLDTSKAIAVFAGCGRTGGESSAACTSTSRDNDIQQCFPYNVWGNEFLTTPFASASGLTLNSSVKTNTIYKVIAKETGTYVSFNNATPQLVPTNGFLSFVSNQPSSFKSNKPITLGQFMTSGNCTTGDGDPEMIYLSAKDRGITKAVFYRNNVEAINSNFVNIIVPNDGLASLKINGQQYPNLGSNVAVYTHTGDTTYSVVVKGWASNDTLATVSCDKLFTGITYGMGGAESYGYNLGSNFYLGTPNVNNGSKPTIKGKIYCDANGNGFYDSSEYVQINTSIELLDSFGVVNGAVFTNNNGIFEITLNQIVAPGIYPLHIKVGGVVDTILFLNISNLDTTIYLSSSFCNFGALDSVTITAVPLNLAPKVGDAYPYWVEYKNAGKRTISAIVDVAFRNNYLTYDSCSAPNVAATPKGLLLSVGNFLAGEVRGFIGYFTVNNAANIGDSIWSTYSIAVAGSSLIAKDSLYSIVVGNDSALTLSATKAISPTQISKGKRIEYTLQFKNTFTHNIKNARIVNVFSNKVKANSLKIISTSHNCKTTLNGNKLVFEFINCNLKDASKKFGKYGYVKFSVEPNSSLPLGSIIENQSTVYLDFYNGQNSNSAKTVVNATGILPVKFVDYNVAVQKENKILNAWKVSEEVNVKNYNAQRSFDGKTFETIASIETGKTSYNYIDASLNVNNKNLVVYYRIEAVDNDGLKTYTTVKSITLNNSKNGISIYPNPSKGSINVKGFDMKEVAVFDMLGKQIQSKQIANSNNQQNTRIEGLKKGIYIISITLNNNTKVIEKLMVD